MTVTTISALAEAVERSDQALPLLRLALENPITARHPKIEWATDGGTEFNYVQTFRCYWNADHNEGDQLLPALLADIDQALESSHRTINGWSRTMGGLRFFLPEGEPFEFRLAILRDLKQRDASGIMPSGTRDWIAGVSVLVRP